MCPEVLLLRIDFLFILLQLSMRMLGNESNKTTDILINPPAREETVNVCLQLHQDTNYSVEVTAELANLLLLYPIIHPVVGMFYASRKC